MRKVQRSIRLETCIGIALVCAVLTTTAPAVAAYKPAVLDDVEQMQDTIRENAAQIADLSRELTQPLEPGETKSLTAAIMRVEGRAQWRPDDEADWKIAEVDDVLAEGAMIRTGSNSSLMLRLGTNATMLVDSHSRITLDELLQEEDVLRTRAGLERGRADIKVDQVGLTNDFSVITPSATLAVRGTGFAVRYGGLGGTSLQMARLQEMTLVELQYFISRYSYLLTQGAISSEKWQNPVLAALLRTIGPPAIMMTLIEDGATPEMLAQGFERIAIWQEQKTLIGLAGLQNTLGLPIFDPGDDPMEEPMFGPEFFAALAEFVCMNVFVISVEFEAGLIANDFFTAAPKEFFATFGSIIDHCESTDIFSAGDWDAILDEIVAFCHHISANQDRIDLCVNIFGQAIVEAGVGPNFQDYFHNHF